MARKSDMHTEHPSAEYNSVRFLRYGPLLRPAETLPLFAFISWSSRFCRKQKHFSLVADVIHRRSRRRCPCDRFARVLCICMCSFWLVLTIESAAFDGISNGNGAKIYGFAMQGYGNSGPICNNNGCRFYFSVVFSIVCNSLINKCRASLSGQFSFTYPDAMHLTV